MKINNKFIKFNILMFSYLAVLPCYSADLNIDFMKRQVFENKLYNAPEPREVSLFSKNKKNEKKKNVVVERTFLDAEQDLLTDKEYVKKLKVANKKKLRKKQFDIKIQHNSTPSAASAKQTVLSKEENIVENISQSQNSNSEVVSVPADITSFNQKNQEEKKVQKIKKKNIDKKVKKDKKDKVIKTKEDKVVNDNQKQNIVQPSNLILSADVTDYFPERSEIEAKGNAKIEMTGQNFILYGDKLIFNHELNTVRAYNNVKIIQDENVTTGDFVNIDLNSANGWIKNPISSSYSVKINAEEAYVYPDKIEEYEGVANILEDRRFEVKGSSYTNLLDSMRADVGDNYLKRPDPTPLTFKVKEINVVPKNGHNEIRMKKVGVFYKKFKLGVMPNVKLVADKEQSYIQTNLPEIGSDSNLGMFIGPSFILNTPLSSTLKISPLLVYSHDEDRLGIGAAGSYMSETNLTQLAYGTPEKQFLLRGYQSITPKLRLNYSQNMHISQWYLGYRKPKYSAELEYADSCYVQDLGVNFQHRLSGGYYSDYARFSKLAEGRLRWMTNSNKNLLTYTNNANSFSFDLGVVGQTSLSQYTTGDTFGIFRVGPSLSTTYRGWSQSLIYFQSAAGGKTPFIFDDYYYGRSNLQVFESLRLNRYITLGYVASMALGGRETYTAGRFNPEVDDFLQENMFLVSLGPDETKLTFIYDAHRKSTAVYLSMLLGTKDMDIAFKKSTINNPDKISGKNHKLPIIKDTFNNVRYKIFPLMDPSFDRKKDLYPEDNYVNSKVLDEYDELLQDELDKQYEQQVKNQFNPILQNQDLMRDNRM